MRRCALPALLMALGCADGTGPAAGDAPGTFTATLSGAVSQTATGTATYGVGLYTYRVDLVQNPNGSGFNLFFNADGGRPSVGTYAVTPITSPQPLPTVNARACVDYTGTCPPVWGVHREPPPGAGRLEITESTPTSVAGTLEVDLRGTADGTGPILHVSARFHARCRESALC